MELLLHQWGDWPELYRNTDKTEATEIVIIDSQMNYRGKLDTYKPSFLCCLSIYLYAKIRYYSELSIYGVKKPIEWVVYISQEI